MILTRKEKGNGQSQMPDRRSPQSSTEFPLFHSLPSLLDQFFYDDPIFRAGNWINNQSVRSTLGTSLPAVNIYETDEDYILEVAAPGMNKKDFKVECTGNLLHISYTHSEEKTEGNQGQDYWRREFNFENFDRSFQLPESANSEQVAARYENGILRVAVAKQEEAKKKPSREVPVA